MRRPLIVAVGGDVDAAGAAALSETGQRI